MANTLNDLDRSIIITEEYSTRKRGYSMNKKVYSVNCWTCKRAISNQASYCPYCGESQEITQEIIYAARQGDEYIIGELYNHTYPVVYSSVYNMISDRDRAFDVVQKAYIKAFKKLDTLRSASSFFAWVWRIAVNQAKDELKKSDSEIPFADLQLNEDIREQQIESLLQVNYVREQVERVPHIALDGKETSRLIQEMLGVLNEKQRMAILLFYYEGRSVAEIAEIMECSENTVKSHLNYARKKIEVKVEELRKQGVKLYSLAPLPFLLLLLREQGSFEVVPSVEGLQQIKNELGILRTSAQQPSYATMNSKQVVSHPATVGATVTKSATTAGGALATKVVAGVLAVVLVGGGTVGAVAWKNHIKTPRATETIQEEEAVSAIASEPVEVSSEPIPEAEEAEPVDEMTLYQPLFAEYADAISSFERYSAQEDDYHFVNRDMMSTLYTADFYEETVAEVSPYTVMYALSDVTGNGVRELLVGMRYNDADEDLEDDTEYLPYLKTTLYDVYTLEGETPISLLEGIDFQTELNSGYLLVNGRVCITVDEEEQFCFYELSEDKTHLLKAEGYIDANTLDQYADDPLLNDDDFDNDPYYNESGEGLTYSELVAKVRAELFDTDSLEWTAFTAEQQLTAEQENSVQRELTTDEQRFSEVLSTSYEELQTWDSGDDENMTYWGSGYVGYLYPEASKERLTKLGYAFYDVNGDGENELLMGSAGEDVEEIAELYTLQDGKPVNLASGGARYPWYLCTNGDLVKEMFGGANVYGWERSTLEGGKLTLVESINYNGSVNVSGTGWTHTLNGETEEISEEDADTIKAGYEHRKLSYTSFSDDTP